MCCEMSWRCVELPSYGEQKGNKASSRIGLSVLVSGARGGRKFVPAGVAASIIYAIRYGRGLRVEICT